MSETNFERSSRTIITPRPSRRLLPIAWCVWLPGTHAGAAATDTSRCPFVGSVYRSNSDNDGRFRFRLRIEKALLPRVYWGGRLPGSECPMGRRLSIPIINNDH